MQTTTIHPKGNRPGRSLGRATLAALLVATAAAAVPMSPAKASAAPATHTVLMGAVDPALPDTTLRPPATAGRTDRFEYLAYYPDHLRVHRGDTVQFRRVGFHTVRFSPVGEAREGWLRRDEAEGVAALRHNVADPACGHDESVPPCLLSSASPTVNSGWDDLTVRVDLSEGAYEYYCTLHDGMQGELEVVADTEPLPTPEEIEAARTAQIALDSSAGAALIEKNQTPDVEVAGDHLRWTVKTGDFTDDERVAVLRYMPSNLQVAPGDEVVFAVPSVGAPPTGRTEAASELHTATFPHDPLLAGFGMLRYLHAACDPDDETTGASGIPGMYASFFFGCPPGMSFELLMNDLAWRSPTRAPGNTVTSPATVHDTGMLTNEDDFCRTGCDPWTGEGFPSAGPATTFPAAGTFSFVCLVHPEWGMAGSISVTE